MSGSAPGARTSRATSTSSHGSSGSATPTRGGSTVSRPASRAARSPTSFDDLLTDPEVEAIVIATPVSTHAALAKQALGEKKHVFVEKPHGAHGGRGRGAGRACAGERARPHARPSPALPPGRREAEGARRRRRARRDPLRVRQPPEPRHDPPGRERALESRRSRPLGDPPSARRGALGGLGARGGLPEERRRGRRLLLPAVPVGEDRAHAPLVARSAQDEANDRGRRQADGGVRRHGARPEGDRLRLRGGAIARELRRVANPHRRRPLAAHPERRAAATRVRSLPLARAPAREIR